MSYITLGLIYLLGRYDLPLDPLFCQFHSSHSNHFSVHVV